MARRLDPVVEALGAAFGPGLGSPFHDPGVGEFGLENAVFAVGDTFVEVVSPVRDGTTAGRYLDRRGGDSGYMAIFQVPDATEARRRIAEIGARVVWQADLPGMSGTHLHPKDTPGAILSIDWADPPDSWRWAGPAWTGQAAPHGPGGVVALTVEVDDPAKAAARWAEIIGCTTTGDATGTALTLDDGRQRVQFVSADGGDAGGVGGITGITIAVPAPAAGGDRSADIGGVRFTTTEAHP